MHPLKSRQGDVVPLTPTRFLKKARQKLLRVTAETLIIYPNEVSIKVFCPLLFKKVAVSKGGAFGGIFKGKALELLVVIAESRRIVRKSLQAICTDDTATVRNDNFDNYRITFCTKRNFFTFGLTNKTTYYMIFVLKK